MNVNNILTKVCVYLNKEDENQLLVQNNAEQINSNQTLNSLLFCLNYVVKKVATEFCYCKAKEDVSFVQDEFDITSLQNNLFSVLSLKNGEDNVKFSQMQNMLYARSGNYTLIYAYLPEDFSFTSDINCFSPCITEDVLALGVCSHYFLLNGFYTEHDVFEKKFLDAVNLATIKKSEKVVKGKQWL